jgi:hypothetical protein
MEQENKTEVMSGEQAADFERLSLAAVEPENAAAALQEEAAQAVESEMLDENVFAIGMIIDLAKPAFHMVGFPTVAKAFETEEAKGLPAAWGAVLTKYGVNLKNWGMAYKEEIAALFVTFPVAKAIYAAIKHDTDAALNRQPEDVPAQEQGAAEVVKLG